MSKFLRPNCTRSRWTISISDRVRQVKGGSVSWTKQSVVGWTRTDDRDGTPLKPSSRIGNLLGKVLELLVESRTPPTLLLFLLKLLLVTKLVPTLTVTRLVELHLCGFSDKLDILGLLLAKHDGVLEVYVDDDDELVLGGLEEQVLHVTEKDVDLGRVVAMDIA
ncbi:Nucleosome binding factor SPN SPT16 subunit [Pyrenophora tritici-repentis]|nr:FACT complex protein [Pyrenophora tritici-repentis]KAI1534003.1 Nucleosome binding factor SPN SPT16 subunit [Pyrenophora tritici-repentis]KAI1537304.1 Nucleosome binding factor SPN SPT16 subunit [Pyrenophora tritici-repentis]KAI1552001.1 Nucleosome binding factor SPN SPT16 subunit [Pyrenophora tritici-repentis]KAI1566180.1 Nucleosome binding factor SPN SPT16 subunit [Pyrenophora tritici-repentis]